MSSVSVLDSQSGLLRSPCDIAAAGGYAASKWVADQLCGSQRLQPQTIGVFRLGLIGWDEHGTNPTDWLNRLLIGCRDLRFAPAAPTATVDLLPRDFACKLVVQLMQSHVATGGLAHWNLINPCNTVRQHDLLTWFCAGINFVPLAQWRVKLREAQAGVGTEASFAGLTLFFDTGLPDDSDDKLSDDTARQLCPQLQWPSIDRHYVDLLTRSLSLSRTSLDRHSCK
jgi:thioester reductase-like protein